MTTLRDAAQEAEAAREFWCVRARGGIETPEPHHASLEEAQRELRDVAITYGGIAAWEIVHCRLAVLPAPSSPEGER